MVGPRLVIEVVFHDAIRVIRARCIERHLEVFIVDLYGVEGELDIAIKRYFAWAVSGVRDTHIPQFHILSPGYKDALASVNTLVGRLEYGI